MGKAARKTRLFVIEDNQLTREMVKSLLQKVRDFEIVGEAADGESAITGVEQTKPDIVVVDIGLPGIDGIETVRRIRNRNSNIKAIMLTAHDSDHDLFQSFQAGAEGYILKTGLTGKRLELAIKSVEFGTVWLDPLIAERVLMAAIANSRPAAMKVAAPVEPLSGEEISVLEKVVGSTPECEGGVCHVAPDFLDKLKRFSKSDAPSRQVMHSSIHDGEPARGC